MSDSDDEVPELVSVEAEAKANQKVPVTIITGYLGKIPRDVFKNVIKCDSYDATY